MSSGIILAFQPKERDIRLSFYNVCKGKRFSSNVNTHSQKFYRLSPKTSEVSEKYSDNDSVNKQGNIRT